MLKLLVTLITFLLLGLAVLGLRQHRLELTAQTASLHDEVLKRRQILLNQQVEMTKVSNPLTLAANLKANGLANDIGVRDPDDGLKKKKAKTADSAADDPGDLIAPLKRQN